MLDSHGISGQTLLSLAYRGIAEMDIFVFDNLLIGKFRRKTGKVSKNYSLQFNKFVQLFLNSSWELFNIQVISCIFQ